MFGAQEKKKHCSGIFYFNIYIFFFLLLFLEAKRESLYLLLRTGRWMRCWWLINSGILSLQIRAEVPTFFFFIFCLLKQSQEMHMALHTHTCVCVCMTGGRGAWSCRWAPEASGTGLHRSGLKLHMDKVLMLADWKETHIQPSNGQHSRREALGHVARSWVGKRQAVCARSLQTCCVWAGVAAFGRKGHMHMLGAWAEACWSWWKNIFHFSRLWMIFEVQLKGRMGKKTE